jgi:hypothetical protein
VQNNTLSYAQAVKGLSVDARSNNNHKWTDVATLFTTFFYMFRNMLSQLLNMLSQLLNQNNRILSMLTTVINIQHSKGEVIENVSMECSWSKHHVQEVTLFPTINKTDILLLLKYHITPTTMHTVPMCELTQDLQLLSNLI